MMICEDDDDYDNYNDDDDDDDDNDDDNDDDDDDDETGDRLMICDWIFILSICVDSRRFESFKKFDVESFFVF